MLSNPITGVNQIFGSGFCLISKWLWLSWQIASYTINSDNFIQLGITQCDNEVVWLYISKNYITINYICLCRIRKLLLLKTQLSLHELFLCLKMLHAFFVYKDWQAYKKNTTIHEPWSHITEEHENLSTSTCQHLQNSYQLEMTTNNNCFITFECQLLYWPSKH